MLGRRRGRNKSSPQEEQDSSTQSTAGTVKLVETSPPPNPEHVDPPRADPGPERSSSPGPIAQSTTPIKKTSSDVATAHAELDSVLPPFSAMSRTVGRAPTPTPSPAASTPPVEESGPGANTPVAPVIEPDLPVQQEPDPPAQQPVAVASIAAEVEVESAVSSQDDVAPAAESAEPDRVAQSASDNPLPRVMAVANQKGGVGKTTTSVNLGAALAELGFRVLVIDLDPQGNATTGLGIDARSFELSMYDVMMRDASLEDCVEPTSMKNLFVAPATIALAGAEIELVPAFSRELKLKRSIESVIDDFDYILIDCPPSLGLITVNALAAADEVLVPIQCEYYALEGLSQLMRNVHLVASNLNPTLDISTIVLTMYDARTKLADQVANEVRQHFGAKVCRSVIPRTVRLSEAPSFGQPITAFDPTSRGAIAYRELAKEVSGGTS
jgi:chromosome partitioning protein